MLQKAQELLQKQNQDAVLERKEMNKAIGQMEKNLKSSEVEALRLKEETELRMH